MEALQSHLGKQIYKLQTSYAVFRKEAHLGISSFYKHRIFKV